MGDACGMIDTYFRKFCFACLLTGLALAPSGPAGERAGPIRYIPADVVKATVSATQAPAPTPAAEPSRQDDFENRPVTFPADSRRQLRQGSARDTAPMPSIWPALFMVALICGGFVFLLVMIKKYLPGHRQLFSHPAMEILGRTHFDQRRYASLLRVGKRIIVIGVSPDEMRTLSEITDDEEITAIMEVARPKSEMGLTIFQKLFKRHVIDTEAAETRALAREKAMELEEQMSSLKERVRAMRVEEDEPSRMVDARA